jgi:hypothetical protein
MTVGYCSGRTSYMTPPTMHLLPDLRCLAGSSRHEASSLVLYIVCNGCEDSDSAHSGARFPIRKRATSRGSFRGRAGPRSAFSRQPWAGRRACVCHKTDREGYRSINFEDVRIDSRVLSNTNARSLDSSAVCIRALSLAMTGKGNWFLSNNTRRCERRVTQRRCCCRRGTPREHRLRELRGFGLPTRRDQARSRPRR